MDVTQDTLFQVENVYLTTLIKLLKSGTLPNKEGKKITRDFLALRPFINMDDMKTKLKNFTDTNHDFLPIYVIVLQHEETHATSSLLERMKGLMNKNKIDEALSLVTTK